MCGIAGIFQPKGSVPTEAVAAVQRMLDAQVHRGPDGEGLMAFDAAVLGHRRLSIIDLSDAGRQPMADEDDTVWMNQPTNDGVNPYFVSKAARESGLTVVISGLGGDEVFWGYRHYRWLAGYKSPVHWLSSLPNLMRRALVNGASAYGCLRGQERWMRCAYLRSQVPGEGLYLLVRGFFAPQQIVPLLGLDRSELDAGAEKSFERMGPRAATGAAEANHFNYTEMKRYLHDQLLRDADTFSMAHSIELRVPYLDHLLVDYAAHIPPALKRRRHVNKPLLVDAVGEPSVGEVGKAQKKGFAFPFGKWVRQHADELEGIASGADLLDRRTVHQLWRAFRAGRLHWSRAWALVVLGAKG